MILLVAVIDANLIYLSIPSFSPYLPAENSCIECRISTQQINLHKYCSKDFGEYRRNEKEKNSGLTGRQKSRHFWCCCWH